MVDDPTAYPDLLPDSAIQSARRTFVRFCTKAHAAWLFAGEYDAVRLPACNDSNYHRRRRRNPTVPESTMSQRSFDSSACRPGANSGRHNRRSCRARPKPLVQADLASNMETAAGGQSQKVDANTDLRYTWIQVGPERILSFDSSRVKANADGKEIMAIYMSRAKYATRKDGKTEVVPFENVPAELKPILQDSYDVPLCKLQVDESGREVKRDVIAGPALRTLSTRA